MDIIRRYNSFLFPVFFSFLLGCNAPQQENTEDAEETIQWKDFTFSDLEGNPQRLNSNRLSFINLWATWCIPCINEMPSLENLMETHTSDMDFYFASYEELGRVKKFQSRQAFTLPFYTYDDSRMPDELATNLLPYTIIVKNGEVVFEKTGGTEWTEGKVYEDILQVIEDHK